MAIKQQRPPRAASADATKNERFEIVPDVLYYGLVDNNPNRPRYYRVESIKDNSVVAYCEIKKAKAEEMTVTSLKQFETMVNGRSHCKTCNTQAQHLWEGEPLCQFHTDKALEARFSAHRKR